MSYCVKLGDWGSIFAVPSSVVDKHIKLVGSSQLKVLLWILRNSGIEFSEQDISKALSIHIDDVKDAIGYWTETGILKFNGFEIIPGEEEKQGNSEKDNITEKLEIKESEETEKTLKDKPRAVSRMLRPDSAYINERINGSEEIKTLMHEAELILGRPISIGDSAILIMLHDNEGLPIDVILMIIQYAVGMGKFSMRYIEAVGISWAKEEVDTIEKAEKKIKNLDNSRRAWNDFERIAGLEHRSPTVKEGEAVNRWYNIWNFNSDIIKEAYEICVNANGRYVLKYIDSIITRWHRSGMCTIEQIRLERDENVRFNKLKKSAKEKYKPSQDTIEYEKNYNIFDQINLLQESLNNEV